MEEGLREGSGRRSWGVGMVMLASARPRYDGLNNINRRGKGIMETFIHTKGGGRIGKMGWARVGQQTLLVNGDRKQFPI